MVEQIVRRGGPVKLLVADRRLPNEIGHRKLGATPRRSSQAVLSRRWASAWSSITSISLALARTPR
jgi:hypothetical protein